MKQNILKPIAQTLIVGVLVALSFSGCADPLQNNPVNPSLPTPTITPTATPPLITPTPTVT